MDKDTLEELKKIRDIALKFKTDYYTTAQQKNDIAMIFDKANRIIESIEKGVIK